MEKSEIERLRKAICRTFNSSPHKKKYWLALLEMRIETEDGRDAYRRAPTVSGGKNKEDGPPDFV
jgi:hypothetical protein